MAILSLSLIDSTTHSSGKVLVTLGCEATFSAHVQKFGASSRSLNGMLAGYTPDL